MAWPCTCYITLDKSCHLSERQFPHLEHVDVILALSPHSLFLGQNYLGSLNQVSEKATTHHYTGKGGEIVNRAALHLESKRHHSAAENRSDSILPQSSFNQAVSFIWSQTHSEKAPEKSSHHPHILQISSTDYIIYPFLVFIILRHLFLVQLNGKRHRSHLHLQMKKPGQRICPSQSTNALTKHLPRIQH